MKGDGGAAFSRDYFEGVYSDYDRQNPPAKLRFYRRLAEAAVEGVARPRVLDVGCAFGRFLAALDPGWERFGVDVSDYAIETARRDAAGAEVAVGALPQIPFAGPFDLVTAWDVLEHVVDLDEARAAIVSRLTPGGALLFVVPVYDGVLGPVVRLLDRDETHVHRRSRRFWLDWARAGFDLADWRGVFRYLLPGGHYVHRPTRLLRRIAPAICAVGRASRGGTGSVPR